MSYMLMPYRRYFEFGGRSRRAEYWMFMLFQLVANLVFALALVLAGFPFGAGMNASPGPLIWAVMLCWIAFSIVSIVPAIAVQVRRFHDQGKTGWLWLLSFIALGGIVVLVFMMFEGERGANRYGPDPKATY